eukprot:15358138-Ditylum_brightwellii.AAC.2
MQAQIAQLRDQHQEAQCLFREVNGIKRIIIQHIVAAVEAKYFKALQNPVTNKIASTVPQIFQHLFDTYGDVTPLELRDLRQNFENYNFNPSKPVGIIHTEINEFADILSIARNPISDHQKDRL